MFIYRKDKSKFIWLIIAFITVLISGLSASAYASRGGIFGSNHAFSSASAHALGVGVGTGYGGGGYGGGAFINTPRIASMAYAPPAYPTATCLKAYSGGGSAAGWGFSGGVTVVDTECRKFEGIRALVNLKRNNVLTQERIDSMIMDVACETESIASSRECVSHNAMRAEEEAENQQVSAAEPTNDPHAGPERTFTLFGLLD